jgi:hypothetical protein
VLSVSGTDATGSPSHYIWKNSAATKQASAKSRIRKKVIRRRIVPTARFKPSTSFPPGSTSIRFSELSVFVRSASASIRSFLLAAYQSQPHRHMASKNIVKISTQTHTPVHLNGSRQTPNCLKGRRQTTSWIQATLRPPKKGNKAIGRNVICKLSSDVYIAYAVRSNEDCWQLPGAPAYCRISKFRRCSAAFTNSDWQPDSYTHTYRNAISNRQPHACCHSAPAVWPADFALTLLGSPVVQPDYRLPLTFGYYGERS